MKNRSSNLEYINMPVVIRPEEYEIPSSDYPGAKVCSVISVSGGGYGYTGYNRGLAGSKISVTGGHVSSQASFTKGKGVRNARGPKMQSINERARRY